MASRPITVLVSCFAAVAFWFVSFAGWGEPGVMALKALGTAGAYFCTYDFIVGVLMNEPESIVAMFAGETPEPRAGRVYYTRFATYGVLLLIAYVAR